MPGKARVDALFALHHIIVRGIERARIFKDDIARNDFPDQIRAAGKGTKPGRGTRAWDEHIGTFEKAGTIPCRRKSVGQAW